MKIDYDYLKKLLETFESSEKPVISFNELEQAGLSENEDVLLFHMQQLEDQSFIARADGEPGLGYIFSVGGEVYWSDIDLRLTAFGYEFLDALRNKEIFNKLKTEFKDNSIGTIVNASKQLLEGFVKKKIGGLLDQ